MHRQRYLSFNVQSLLLILALGIGWPSVGSTAPADILKAEPGDLVFIIQPILNEEQTKRAYQPLADYLSKIAGKRVVIRTLPNFVAYWEVMRLSNAYDLVLDAAHFTDYRAKKLGFKVLAKIPDTVSYSLIVGSGALVIDPIELIGKTVATPGRAFGRRGAPQRDVSQPGTPTYHRGFRYRRGKHPDAAQEQGPGRHGADAAREPADGAGRRHLGRDHDRTNSAYRALGGAAPERRAARKNPRRAGERAQHRRWEKDAQGH